MCTKKFVCHCIRLRRSFQWVKGWREDTRINEDGIFKNIIFLFVRNLMIVNSKMKVSRRRSRRMTSFKIYRRWLIRDCEVVEVPFKVGSGVGLESRGSEESVTRGISRVPDLRERGGDNEAILDKSSSSGFIFAILESRKKFKTKVECETNVRCMSRLEKVCRCKTGCYKM